MAISIEPGEEIRLDVESKRAFFAKAMSWRDQKAYAKLEEAAKDEENGTVETDNLLAAIVTRLTRTDPPIELTVEALEGVVDLKLIWELNAAVRFNVTYEEKKS